MQSNHYHRAESASKWHLQRIFYRVEDISEAEFNSRLTTPVTLAPSNNTQRLPGVTVTQQTYTNINMLVNITHLDEIWPALPLKT